MGFSLQCRLPLPKKDLNTGEPLTVLIVPLLRPAVVVHLLLWVRHPPNWLLTKLQSEGKMFPMVPSPPPPSLIHLILLYSPTKGILKTDFKFCLEKSGRARIFFYFSSSRKYVSCIYDFAQTALIILKYYFTCFSLPHKLHQQVFGSLQVNIEFYAFHWFELFFKNVCT
jgi:hypothetical protein